MGPIAAIIILIFSITKFKTKQKIKRKTVQFSNIMDILVFTKAEPMTPRRRKLNQAKVPRGSCRDFIKLINNKFKRRGSLDLEEEERLHRSILKYGRRKSF